MSDGGGKSGSSAPASSSSVAPSPSSRSLDQSLVHVFGSLENALRDLGTFVRSSDRNQHERHAKLAEKIDDLNLYVAKLADAYLKNTTAENLTLDATVDARNALNNTRERLEKTVEDVSQKILLHQHESLEEFEGLPRAPRLVRRAAAFLADLGWKYMAKFAVSTLTAGAAFKILYEAVAPFIAGLH